MVENFENRDKARIDHISSLQVKDLGSGKVCEARMFNYSHRGIYLESDSVFEKGTPIYIGIQDSPFSFSSGVLEYYKGEIMWRKNLKRSFFNYGYGVQLVLDSSKKDLDFNDAKKAKESRKHPRKPFSRTIRFGTLKGISEGTTKNISPSGVFIATEERFEIGQLLKLNLPLKAGKTKKIIGEIVWVTEEGFGVKFNTVK